MYPPILAKFSQQWSDFFGIVAITFFTARARRASQGFALLLFLLLWPLVKSSQINKSMALRYPPSPSEPLRATLSHSEPHSAQRVACTEPHSAPPTKGLSYKMAPKDPFF
jgi:hypothetical protein